MSGVYTRKCAEDIFDTSEGALPLQLQRIAEEELGETTQKRLEALQKLKQLLSDEPDLNANKDTAFLLRFLRVRKYNIDLAQQTIRNYYRNRAAGASLYHDFLPSKTPPHARKLVMALPNTDVHGRPVFICRPGAWIPSEADFVDTQRAALICLEHLASDPAAQTLGITLIADYGGFTPDKMFYSNIGVLRRAVEYIQDCMPIRMKKVHFVKQSYAFDLLFALIRPFIKAKMAERFHFHGANFEKLLEEISPQALPEEYGGEAPPLDFDAFWSQLDAEESHFVAGNRFGYAVTEQDDLPEDVKLSEESTAL